MQGDRSFAATEVAVYSRRDFAKLSLVGLPLVAAVNAADGASIGATSFSFREFPRTPGQDNVDAVIKGLKFAGVAMAELSSADTEAPVANNRLPAPGAMDAYSGAVREITPADLAEVKKAVREGLRKWRLYTPDRYYTAIREKFAAAGIGLFAYTVNYDDSFTPEEIEGTFRQAKALGVSLVSSSTTLPVAARLAPLAEKHGVIVAFHNAPSAKDSDAIATTASFTKALALSKNFRINLDIGNFTAVGGESVAYVQENAQSISHVTIKDRTRKAGSNETFGEGDTPIKAVLALLKAKHLAIPAFVEYEYVGLGTAPEEVRKCVAYVRSALA